MSQHPQMYLKKKKLKQKENHLNKQNYKSSDYMSIKHVQSQIG